MAAPVEIARRYFDALSAHDLDAAVACWQPGAIDRFVGDVELVAPDGVRSYFEGLFSAFPDFSFEIIDLTAEWNRVTVQWRVTATFAGPGMFQGFSPNGAVIALEGCDVVRVEDDLIVGNVAYVNQADVARQLGFLPPAGSSVETRMAGAANLRTRVTGWLHGHGEPEWIAEGVWVVRGGRPRTMNVYLVEDEGGVTVFDAGIRAMAPAVRAAAARLGGVRRVVLGHADADHRGVAPALGAPVFCHALEREAAESDEPFRPYWNFDLLPPVVRSIYPALLKSWDGGGVPIAGTLREGDPVAGFQVIELPGHAPGLIGLFRERDRFALVSDCFYTIDPVSSRRGAARVPHAAFDHDVATAAQSIRKLAGLEPSIAWAGHADPVSGEVVAQLLRAADGA